MRFTKVVGFLSVLGLAAVFPLSAQAEKAGTAGAGEWDKLGTYTYILTQVRRYTRPEEILECAFQEALLFLFHCTYMRMIPVTILMIM